MKTTSRILFAFLILAAISAGLSPTKAQAGSRVYVGVDLGNLVVPMYSGPRYVYSPPVIYERPAWRPAPYPYPPPRWRHHPPPPPPRYDRHHHSHRRDHHWDDYRR